MDAKESVAMSTDVSERMLVALGYKALLSTCADVFLREPDETMLATLRYVAGLVDDRSFDDVAIDASAVRRFHNRMFVTTSEYYVPLRESCICKAAWENGRWHYGSTTSQQTNHVAKCYNAVGFSVVDNGSNAIGLSSQAPDSIASELLFLAFLKQSEVAFIQRGEYEAAHHYYELAAQFINEHAGIWVDKAVECLQSTDNDLYARVSALAFKALCSMRDDAQRA